MPSTTALRRCAALLACGAAVLPATASAAPDPTHACGSPGLSKRILETPSLMVTYDRSRDGEFKTRACWRGRRAPELLGEDYDVNFVSGGVELAGLIAGRYVVLDRWESSTSDDGSSSSQERQLHDARTGRSTALGDEHAAVGLPGMLTHGRRKGLVLRAPGRRDRVVTSADGAMSPALGKRTAYWTDAAGAAVSAKVPLQLRSTKEPKGRLSPRDAHGPCEPAGSRTLLRLAGGRIFAVRRGGFPFLCAGKSKRTISVYDVPGDDEGALTAKAYTPISDRHVAFEQALVGSDGVRIVVVDVRTAKVVHLARADDGFAGAVPTPRGILVADGAGVRWITGRSSTVLSTEPGADPGLAEAFETSEGNGEDEVVATVPARAYWTTPGGPRSAPLP